MLLQGIVDCCFGGKDGPLTVLDFKTDRVKGEELRLRAERYRPQLEAYSGALEPGAGAACGAEDPLLPPRGGDGGALRGGECAHGPDFPEKRRK